MTILVVAAAVVIGLLAVLVTGLTRKNAEILRRLADAEQRVEVSPTGAEARDIAGMGLNGKIVGVRVRDPDRSTLLAFMSSTCSGCDRFWTAFGDADKMAGLGDTQLIIVTSGDGYEVPVNVAEVAPREIPLVMSSIAWQTYGIPGSPYFVVISGETGLITAKDRAGDWDGLLTLVRSADGES
jgi:hypothetical protein